MTRPRDMGAPVNFHQPYRSPNESRYVQEVLDSGCMAGNGPFTQRVHDTLSDYLAAPNVLLTHSCTAALEMAALLADFKARDEVIIPTFTFCSTASAFARIPATIVFCDIDPSTMMATAESFASKVTERTKAIVPVHYGGHGVDMASLRNHPKLANVMIIEDAAQTFGAKQGGRAYGTMGDLGCLSFHATKNVHGGLAGALIVNDSNLADQARRVWERGTNRQAFVEGRSDRYTWTDVGSSFYPSELQAALLLAQLQARDLIASKRAAIAAVYREVLEPLRAAGEVHFPKVPAGQETNNHIFWLQLPNADQAKQMRLGLQAAGFDCPAHYFPLHHSPMGHMLGYVPEDLPLSVSAAERMVRLPVHTEMSRNDAHRVARAVLDWQAQTATTRGRTKRKSAAVAHAA